MTTVVCTACMDRKEYLLASVESWHRIGLPIFVLDWSSHIPIASHENFTVGRVENKPFYHHSKTMNAAIRFARKLNPDFTHVLLVQADTAVNLNDRWLMAMLRSPKPDTFLRGHSGGCTGTTLFPYSIWEKVGGYNELLDDWGFQDLDFFQRTAKFCASRRLPRSSLIHADHPEHLRTVNLADKNRKLTNQRNREIATSTPWNNEMEPQEISYLRNGELVKEWI